MSNKTVADKVFRQFIGTQKSVAITTTPDQVQAIGGAFNADGVHVGCNCKWAEVRDALNGVKAANPSA